MKFCPRNFITKQSWIGADIEIFDQFEIELLEKMETCCESNVQCDKKKRTEMKISTFIGKHKRYCKCEKAFRNCIFEINSHSKSTLSDFYVKNTSKCYH